MKNVTINKIIAYVLTNIMLLLFLGSFNLCPGQSTNSSEYRTAPDSKTHDGVLDILFPRDEAFGIFGYGFVLRFEPSFDAESQITLVNESGELRLIEYKSLSGNIYYKLADILSETEIRDVDTLAKKIRVSRRVVAISPALAKKWRAEFYQKLAQTGEFESRSVDEENPKNPQVDDGTAYLLWYRGVGEIHFNYQGGSENRPPRSTESPIISWMKQVKQAVDKLPTVKENSSTKSARSPNRPRRASKKPKRS